jgi:hypothetical protein
MHCPECGAADADFVTANFWTCKNGRCKHAGASALKTKPSDDELAFYVCDTCRSGGYYAINSVAAGLACPLMNRATMFGYGYCGGVLRLFTK